MDARAAPAFLSDAWHRIAQVRCWLRPGLRVVPVAFRGRQWYALQDPANGRIHRVSGKAWSWLAQLLPDETLDENWRRMIAGHPDDAPGQGELIELVMELSNADLLQADRPADIAGLMERRKRQRRPLWLQNLMNPLSARLPLYNPDALLSRLTAVLRPLIGPPAWTLWLLIVVPACVVAGMHADALTENLAVRLLSPSQWLVVVPLLFALKFVHEIAHGVMVKQGGGTSTELGLMFLVLMPVPYVDASSTNAMASKWQRAAVGIAGMWIELLACALAVYAWALLEPGFLRGVAHQVILATGIATLIFNGNPLLRFDGYYVLCDLIEIPNLGTRSNALWLAMLRRHVLGDREHELPDMPRDEFGWVLAYAPLSLIYRLVLTLGIALFVAQAYPFVGAVLAVLAIGTALVWPLAKGLGFVLGDARLGRQRPVMLLRMTLGVTALAVVLLAVPVPRTVVTEGVLWAPPEAELRAGEEGQIAAVHVQHGDTVAIGRAVASVDSPELQSEWTSQQAKVQGLDVRLQAELWQDRLRAALTEAELQRERAALDILAVRRDALVARAGLAGEVQLIRGTDLIGRSVSRGDLLGLVDTPLNPRVRTVLAQDDVGLVRAELQRVEIAIVDRPGEVLRAQLLRHVSGGDSKLPSRALSLDGGGPWATDPSDADGLTTLQRVFEIDLALAERPALTRLGTKAWIKFVLSPEPLGWQCWRRLRQLFLARLSL